MNIKKETLKVKMHPTEHVLIDGKEKLVIISHIW